MPPPKPSKCRAGFSIALVVSVRGGVGAPLWWFLFVCSRLCRTVALTASLLSRSLFAAVSESGANLFAALVNLGYQPGQALSAVSVAAKKINDGAEVEALISGGLKELATIKDKGGG